MRREGGKGSGGNTVGGRDTCGVVTGEEERREE